MPLLGKFAKEEVTDIYCVDLNHKKTNEIGYMDNLDYQNLVLVGR
jgi:hypothetical protein